MGCRLWASITDDRQRARKGAVSSTDVLSTGAACPYCRQPTTARGRSRCHERSVLVFMITDSARNLLIYRRRVGVGRPERHIEIRPSVAPFDFVYLALAVTQDRRDRPIVPAIARRTCPPNDPHGGCIPEPRTPAYLVQYERKQQYVRLRRQPRSWRLVGRAGSGAPRTTEYLIRTDPTPAATPSARPVVPWSSACGPHLRPSPARLRTATSARRFPGP